MFGDKEKALLNGGHISKKIKVIGLIFASLVSAFLLWIYISYSATPKLGLMTTETYHTSSASMIQKVQSSNKILLYQDYILINGLRYQIKMVNGHIMVLKDGAWIPLATMSSASNNAIISQSGQLYRYEKGHLVPLNTGEIIHRGNSSYIVGSDGKLHKINTNGVIWKNGKPYTLDSLGHLHAIKDGQVVMLNGHRMMWKNGKFIPIKGMESNTNDGMHTGEIIHRGNSSYIVGSDGKLHKINTNGVIWKNGKPYTLDSLGHLHAIKDGQVVMLNGHRMMWKNGKFIPIKGIEPKNGSFGVAMGRNGDPLYYEYKNGKRIAVPKSALRSGSIVYYHGKPYRVGKDGKLHDLKAGDTIWRNGKLYVVSPSGELRQVKEGEFVDVHSKPFIYKNGKLVPMSREDAADAIANKSVAWINGKPYLMDASGHQHLIREGEIIFRGGQAYRYINGHFIKLTPEELAVLNKPKVIQKKPPKVIKKPVIVHQLVGSSDEIKAALASGFGVTVVHEQEKSNTLNHVASKSEDNSQQNLTNNIINAIKNHSNNYSQANMQSSKRAFMSDAQNGGIPSSKTDYQTITSPYTISMGTTIDATLITGINSDLPGSITAQVNSNVYDSTTGNFLLIPQGTKVFGKYDSEVSQGQSRVLLAWTTLILPDGTRVDLQGQPGVDLQGLAGLTGDIDNHWGTVFKNVLMMSVFGAGVQVAAGGASGGTGSANSTQLIAASLGQQLGQAGLSIIKRSMNIQPTINIASGDNFKILLTRDFIMPSPYRNFNKPALIFQK